MPPVQSTDRSGIKYTLSHFGNASVKSTGSTLCYPRAPVCSSSLAVTIQLSISAEEYLRSKRLAEAKGAILFPRVYPDYHHVSLSSDPKTSNMIPSKSGRGGLFIVFVGRLHCTIRSSRISSLPCCSTERNMPFEVSAATLHKQATTELKSIGSFMDYSGSPLDIPLFGGRPVRMNMVTSSESSSSDISTYERSVSRYPVSVVRGQPGR